MMLLPLAPVRSAGVGGCGEGWMVETQTQGRPVSPMLTLAIIALPGWLLVVGAALSTWLYDTTSWSWAPFGVGAIASISVLKLGDFVIGEDPRADEKGRIPWLSDVASEIRLSRGYLTRSAKTAGLPESAVIPLAWAPWVVMLGFWVFLVLNMIVQLASGSG